MPPWTRSRRDGRRDRRPYIELVRKSESQNHDAIQRTPSFVTLQRALLTLAHELSNMLLPRSANTDVRSEALPGMFKPAATHYAACGAHSHCCIKGEYGAQRGCLVKTLNGLHFALTFPHLLSTIFVDHWAPGGGGWSVASEFRTPHPENVDPSLLARRALAAARAGDLLANKGRNTQFLVIQSLRYAPIQNAILGLGFSDPPALVFFMQHWRRARTYSLPHSEMMYTPSHEKVLMTDRR